MMKRRLSRIALQGMAAAAALALAACGAEPYPTPAPEAPKPAPPADLAGAPLPPAAASTTISSSSSTYSAGPNSVTSTYSSSSTSTYSSGTGPVTSPYSSSVIVAMAPIPNPPEGRHEHHLRHHASSGYQYIAPVAPAHATVKAAARPVAHKAAVAAKGTAKPVLKPAAKLAAAPKVTPAAKPGPAAALSAAAPAAGNAEGASPLGDRATRLAALETALADAVKKGAELKAPDSFTAAKPADVTLTVPASFSDSLKDEAMKNDLTDAAAAVNLTAVLSGDGFAVTPDTAQSQPLTAGQPTVFHWTVTAQDGAKGPLHADVGADLLGAGSDVLNLGSIQAGDNFGMGMLKSNRILGIGILVVLAVLVLAWLARGRSGPTRSVAARREARRNRGAQPVILGDNEL